MWLVIGLTMILLFNLFNKPQTTSSSLTYSDFMSKIENKSINRVRIEGDTITGTLQDGTPFRTIYPVTDAELIPILRDAGVDINVKEEPKDSWFMTIFVSWFPMLLLIGVWDFLHAADAGWRQRRCPVFWQEQGPADGTGRQQGYLCRCCRHR